MEAMLNNEGGLQTSLNVSHSLSVCLRLETRVQHEKCEQAMALDMSLRNGEAYIRLLQRLRKSYTFLANERIFLEAQEVFNRRGEIQADLDRIASDVGTVLADQIQCVSLYASFAEALGGLYVVTGSRLGGQVISRLVQDRLPGVPMRFFTADGCPLGADWHKFKTQLNLFGEQYPDAHGDVYNGAKLTFQHFEHFIGEWVN